MTALLPAPELAAEQADRWRAADKLLPPPMPIPPDDGDRPPLVAHDDTGRLVGIGAILRDRPQPEELRFTYTAADQHLLFAHVSGGSPAGALDQLLGQWRDRLVGMAEVGPDSAAVVMWPSRDTIVQSALVRHGLAPLTGLGVRPAGAGIVAGADEVPANFGDVRVRAATSDDEEAVFRLRLEEVRYATQFGLTTFREHTIDLLRSEVVADIGAEDTWTWVAERAGEIVGAVEIAPPGKSGWVASMVGSEPAAYVTSLAVVPGKRGAGVGGALAGVSHQQLDDAGVAATLGFYSLANPLSVPFWSRLGYRPLWTFWETRPAPALR
jgi:GNAT superfamily N-acetyltransferase